MNEDPTSSHDPAGAIFCITGMAVRLSHRGRGLGMAVAKHLLEIAQEQGCHQVILEITHAQGLWRRLGFLPTTQREQGGAILTVMQREMG